MAPLPSCRPFVLPHYCRSVLFWKAWTVFHLIDRCNRYLTCRAHQCIHDCAALQSQALCLLCGRACFVCVCCWWCQLPLLLRRDTAECFSPTSVFVSLLLSFSYCGSGQLCVTRPEDIFWRFLTKIFSDRNVLHNTVQTLFVHNVFLQVSICFMSQRRSDCDIWQLPLPVGHFWDCFL